MDPAFGEVQSFPVPGEIPAMIRRRFVGTYVNPDGTDSFVIGLENEHPTLAYSGSRESMGLPVVGGDGGLVFTLYDKIATGRGAVFQSCPWIGGSASFSTNSVGQVTTLTWSQSGFSTSYKRHVTPPRLQLSRTGDSLDVRISGEADRDYILERSTDLQNWTVVSTNSIWDSPIRMPIVASRQNEFYRLKEP
jgi:hypothetical protein